MEIESIVIYVAGYVTEFGREVIFMTADQEIAFNWTKENQKYGALAVFRGLYQDDLDCGCVDCHYIEDHLLDSHEVCGFDGIYTNEFLAEVEKLAA